MQHLARHVHYADGRPGNGKITDRQILNIARAQALNSSLSGVLDKPSPPDADPSLARHSSVQGRYGGTGVHDQSRRNSRESSAGKKTDQLLTDCGVGAVWINVKHLASAIDNHPKFVHLPGTEQTIEMRQSIDYRDMRSRGWGGRVCVHVGCVGQRDWHIGDHAIAQGDALRHAHSIVLPSFPKNSAYVDGGVFDF